MNTRRTILAGLAGGAILRPFGIRAAHAAGAVLRVGDQKGGARSLMKAAGALDGLSYGVEWSQFAAAAPLLEALNAEAIDCGFAGDAPTTFALGAGVPAHVIASTRASGENTAIMVPASSSIRSVAELKGRTVATNRGSIGHSLVLAIIETQGWTAADFKIVNLLPSEAKAALSTGAVDSWCSWGVYVAQARLIDNARIVADGRNGLMSGLSYLVARNDAVAGRREALLDFCRRVAHARRWANTHRDEYTAVLAADIGVTPAVARLIYERETPLPVPINDAVITDQQKTIDRYRAAGVIRSRLEASTLFDTSFNSALG